MENKEAVEFEWEFVCIAHRSRSSDCVRRRGQSQVCSLKCQVDCALDSKQEHGEPLLPTVLKDDER